MLRTAALLYDTNEAGDYSAIDCSKEPSMTKQSFKEECDINTIVRRFGLSGELPQGLVMPTYQDFEGVFDFQTAMNALIEAEDKFMQMPAHVRARFGNDPHEFVKFCSDEKNREEAAKLGLVPKPAQVVPAVAPASSAAPAAPGTGST